MLTVPRSFPRPFFAVLGLLLLGVLPVGAQDVAGPPPPTPPLSQGAADAVFADEGYQRGLDTTHTTIEDVIELARHLIMKSWQGLMDWLEALFLTSPVLGWIVFFAMIALLVVLLWHIGWTFTRAFKGPAPDEDLAEGDAKTARRRRYRDLREEASRHAQAGDAREGIRFLLLALLALLAEEHMLAVARSWTPREILRRVGARVTTVGLSEMLSFETEVENALYGPQAVASEDFATCSRVLDVLAGSLRSLPRSDR